MKLKTAIEASQAAPSSGAAALDAATSEGKHATKKRTRRVSAQMEAPDPLGLCSTERLLTCIPLQRFLLHLQWWEWVVLSLPRWVARAPEAQRRQETPLHLRVLRLLPRSRSKWLATPPPCLPCRQLQRSALQQQRWEWVVLSLPRWVARAPEAQRRQETSLHLRVLRLLLRSRSKWLATPPPCLPCRLLQRSALQQQRWEWVVLSLPRWVARAPEAQSQRRQETSLHLRVLRLLTEDPLGRARATGFSMNL